jgi:hypothetical protein
MSSKEDAMARPVPIRRRTLLRLAALAPALRLPAAPAPASAAAPPSRHAHRTIIGVI